MAQYCRWLDDQRESTTATPELFCRAEVIGMLRRGKRRSPSSKGPPCKVFRAFSFGQPRDSSGNDRGCGIFALWDRLETR